jgi:uncharacterized protein YkwD
MKFPNALVVFRFPLLLASLLLFVAILAPVGIYAQSTNVVSMDYLTQQEREVLAEINLVRADPQKYASYLEAARQYYKGNLFKRPGAVAITTEEGVKAVDEAIAYLRSLKPMPPMQISKGMCMGSHDQATDQGQTGAVSHQGFDRSTYWERVRRYGEWSDPISENIAYDDGTARDVVMNFIIDDGVPGRGHRNNLFNAKNLFLGVSCGKHPTYGAMCVCTFAGDYKEKTTGTTQPAATQPTATQPATTQPATTARPAARKL